MRKKAKIQKIKNPLVKKKTRWDTKLRDRSAFDEAQRIQRLIYRKFPKLISDKYKLPPVEILPKKSGGRSCYNPGFTRDEDRIILESYSISPTITAILLHELGHWWRMCKHPERMSKAMLANQKFHGWFFTLPTDKEIATVLKEERIASQLAWAFFKRLKIRMSKQDKELMRYSFVSVYNMYKQVSYDRYGYIDKHQVLKFRDAQ